MPRGIPSLNETQKQEIIKRITDKGERAVDLAKEYKVDPKIIYNLLKTKANQHQAVLELAKLKRENEALISIIGQLVADSKIGKKRNKQEILVNYFSSSKKAQVSKSVACAKVLISRNSLYYKPKLPAKDLLLKQQIETILFEHKSYGHRRIAIALGINKKRVLRIMKLFNLKPKKPRKKPIFKKNKFQKTRLKI